MNTLTPKMNEILNVVHEQPFSILLPNYSYLVGVAGGIFLIWVVFVLLRKKMTSGLALALPMAVVFAIAGMVNVMVEVHQPGRLIYTYLYGWNYITTAFIKWAEFLLPLFILFSWWMAMQTLRDSYRHEIDAMTSVQQKLLDFFSLWSRHYSVFEHQHWRLPILLTALLLGLFPPMYSGLYLMAEHGISFWNTAIIPLLFLVTGVAAGAGCYLVLFPLFAKLAGMTAEEDLHAYAPILLITSLLAGFLWISYQWWLSHFGDISGQRALEFFNTQYHSVIWLHWLIPGIIIPVVGLLFFSHQRWMQILTGCCAIYAAYAIRFIIIIGGESLNRTGFGFKTFSPASHALSTTFTNLFLLLGLIALFLWLFPFEKIVFSNKQKIAGTL